MELDTHIENFLRDCRAANLAKKTITWYAGMLAPWRAFVGDRDWRDLNLTRAFIDELQSRDKRYADHPRHPVEQGGVSVSTVRGYVRTLRRFFNWLVSEKVLSENPIERLRMPKAPKRMPRAMLPDDFAAMMNAAEIQRDRALLMVLRDSGCRVSEISGLRVRDVDARGVLFVCGKGNKERFAFLGDDALAELRAYLEERKEIKVGDWLFLGRDSKRLTSDAIGLVLKRLAKRAGIAGKHNPHSLRHAFGRDWVLNGGGISSLADVLGHTDLETTRVYSVFAVDELRKLHKRYSPLANEKTSG